MALAEDGNIPLHETLVSHYFLLDSEKTYLFNDQAVKTNFHLVSSRTIYCMGSALSTTRLYEQWSLEQAYPVGGCSSVCHLPLLRPHLFGHLQQHPRHNAGGLNRVPTVHTVDQQAAICISIPPVLAGNCAWRDTPLTSATVFIYVEGMAPEISNTDVMTANGWPASSYLPYMTIAVPMRRRENLSTVVRSPMKHCLNTATAAATAVTKEEDVLKVREAAERFHL